jgi:hypothetical protein
VINEKIGVDYWRKNTGIREKKYSQKACISVTLTTTNPKCTGPSGFGADINNMSHGTD